MSFRSVLKPESSVMAALAVAGTVYAIYQLNIGSTSQAHATDANHPALESGRKKAGYTSFILVSGIFLLTRDANVGTLGYGSIVAMEVIYRHSIMADPNTGRIQAPAETAYQPAENVIPLDVQAQPEAVGY